jgi:hypothetical protein
VRYDDETAHGHNALKLPSVQSIQPAHPIQVATVNTIASRVEAITVANGS